MVTGSALLSKRARGREVMVMATMIAAQPDGSTRIPIGAALRRGGPLRATALDELSGLLTASG